MLTTHHFGTIDDADGDTWINVDVTVDSSLSIQRVRLTGSVTDILDQLSVAQIAQIRSLIDKAEPKLRDDLRQQSLEEQAEEYWANRA